MSAEPRSDQLPSHWQLARISEKFVFTTKPRRRHAEGYETIAFVPMDRLPSDRLFFSDFELRFPREIASGTYFEEGDFLLSKITPCFENGKQGIATRVPGGFGLATTEVIPIKPIEGVSYLPFLALYLLDHDVRTGLAGKMEGATGRQRLGKSALGEWTMPYPPLAEQRAIAVVLAKIQEAVEVQDRIVATLKELKAAAMAKLFREGLRGEPLKQTEIGEIPESWEVVRLGDAASVERGKFAHRPRNHPRFYGGLIPFIQTGDVTKCNGRIRAYSQTLNEEGLSISRLFPKGTIVLTIAANIADTGILEFDSAFPDSLVGITPDQTIDPAFLEYYLRTQKSEMNRLAPKGTQKNINIQFLRPWPVPRPSIHEQRAIIHGLRIIDDRLAIESARLDVLKSSFSSMLHLLITGEVRLSIVTGRIEAGNSVDPGNSPIADKLIEQVERFVAELVRGFQPDRVVQFEQLIPGSPKVNAEMGLLVVMPFEGRALAQAVRIEREVAHEFPLEVVVRRPEEVDQAVEIGDGFVKGILERGRTLYVRPGTAERREQARRPEQPPHRGKLSEETLREIVQRIVGTVHPEKIILFGSAARGEMGPDSDVDLMVVKTCTNRREVAGTIRQSLMGVAPGLPKDVIVVAPEELERHKNTIGLIYRPALREGRVVYAT
jgi:type I restriction enzyme S subunit